MPQTAYFIYFAEQITDYPVGGISAFMSHDVWTYVDNHHMLSLYWRYFQMCTDRDTKMGFIYTELADADASILILKGYKIETVTLTTIDDQRTYYI